MNSRSRVGWANETLDRMTRSAPSRVFQCERPWRAPRHQSVGFAFVVYDNMSEKVKMRDGDTLLIMVKGGEVIHFTPNMSLPHSEFVKRTTGQLPAGAWVGTVSKLDGEVAAISSKHFFGYQLPAPPEVADAVRRKFE